MVKNNKEQYARLCWLLGDVGTQTLRKVFDSVYSPVHFREHISRIEIRILVDKIQSQGKITDRQRELLYPSKPHRSVSSKSFKFDLLIALLQNICHMSAPYPNGWNKLPLPDDRSLSADITRLKVAKDILSKTDSVLEEEFDEIWTSVTEAILRLDKLEGKRKIYRVQSEILASEYMQDQFIQKIKAKEPTKSENPQPEIKKKLLKQRSSMSPFKDIPPTLGPGEGISEEDTIVLDKNFKLLIESILMADILDYLKEKCVLTDENCEKINSIHRNAPKMRYLLSIISTTPNQQAFKLFCEAIKEKYPEVHGTIVKTRHQIYKQGNVNKTDLMGYCKTVVIQQYKNVYTNIAPIPWEDFSDNRENFFIPLQIFNDHGEEVLMKNLFPHKSAIKILQGPPGCGKSTLCRMLAKTWATSQDSFSSKFDLILYLDLARIGKSDIIDAIYRQILPENFKMNRENFKSVLQTNIKQVLFIFDSLVDGVQNEDIERILQRNLLTGCSVLAVTLPSWSPGFNVRINSFIYTQGIANKNIVRCIKTFTNLVDIEEKTLNKYLESVKGNQEVLQTLRIPLVSIYLISNPEELPELEDLANFTLVVNRFLNFLVEDFFKDSDLAPSGGKVLESAKKLLKDLEKLAYKHLLEGQTLITGEEMECLDVEALGSLAIFTPAGSHWLYQCSLWRDILAARHLQSYDESHFKIAIDTQQLLFHKRFNQMMQFFCTLEKENKESTKFSLMARVHAAKNEKCVQGIAFTSDVPDEEDGTRTKRKGKLVDFAESFSAVWSSGNNTEMLETISQSLPSCLGIKSSHLFPDTALLGLSTLLPEPTTAITEIDISLSRLHDFQAHNLLKLAKAIATSSQLHTLKVTWLSMNITARFLGAALQENTSIRLVHVEREPGRHALANKQTAEMWAGLQAASSAMKNVECFRLIDCPYPAIVGHVIRHLPATLPELDISNCAFDMVCGQRLASLLEYTTSLKSLNISGIKMGNTEFAAFVSGIKMCPSLQTMRVSETQLGRQAFLSLCESLLMAKNIESLDLSGCHLTTEMGSRLAEITEQVTSLKTLNLINSDITQEGRSLIELSSPRSLKVLGIQKPSKLPPIIGGH